MNAGLVDTACRAFANTRVEPLGQGVRYRIGRGKCFAVWVTEGDQPGLHLRTVDAQPGCKPSTLGRAFIEQTHNFIWFAPARARPDDALGSLLAKSHALATRKDGGVVRGGPWRDRFIVLRKALEATPAALCPPGLFHAGGPAAKILGNEGSSSVALANFCLEWLDEAPAGVLRRAKALAKHAHQSRMGGYETRASSQAAQIAVLVVEQLVSKRDGRALAHFLEALDDRILAAEFGAVTRLRTGTPLECERVLWRGSDPKGNAGQWLARLSRGRYALLRKLGARWVLHDGERDEVLAQLSDDVFSAAARVAQFRDTPGEYAPGAVVANPLWKKSAPKRSPKRPKSFRKRRK